MLDRRARQCTPLSTISDDRYLGRRFDDVLVGPDVNEPQSSTEQFLAINWNMTHVERRELKAAIKAGRMIDPSRFKAMHSAAYEAELERRAEARRHVDATHPPHRLRKYLGYLFYYTKVGLGPQAVAWLGLLHDEGSVSSRDEGPNCVCGVCGQRLMRWRCPGCKQVHFACHSCTLGKLMGLASDHLQSHEATIQQYVVDQIAEIRAHDVFRDSLVAAMVLPR